MPCECPPPHTERLVTELFPPQALLLRDEGGAGRLGERRGQDDGKLTLTAAAVFFFLR